MAYPDEFREIAYAARAIPGAFGLRPYSVAIVRGTWSGSYPGRGAETTGTIAVTESGGYSPKVRFANAEEIALGQLSEGDATIGPITPDFPGGGTLLSVLAPAVAGGETVHLILTGPQSPSGAKYRIRYIDDDHAIHYTIRCTPVSEP